MESLAHGLTTDRRKGPKRETAERLLELDLEPCLVVFDDRLLNGVDLQVLASDDTH